MHGTNFLLVENATTAKWFHAEKGRQSPGRPLQTLEEAAKAIGEGLFLVQANESKLEYLERLFRHVMEAMGYVDVLFVNAGVEPSALSQS